MFSKRRCNSCAIKVSKKSIFNFEDQKLCKECYEMFLKSEKIRRISRTLDKPEKKKTKKNKKSTTNDTKDPKKKEKATRLLSFFSQSKSKNAEVSENSKTGREKTKTKKYPNEEKKLEKRLTTKTKPNTLAPEVDGENGIKNRKNQNVKSKVKKSENGINVTVTTTKKSYSEKVLIGRKGKEYLREQNKEDRNKEDRNNLNESAKAISELEGVIKKQEDIIKQREKEILEMKERLEVNKNGEGKKKLGMRCRLKSQGICIHEVMLQNERGEFEKKVVSLKVELANYMDQVNNLQYFIHKNRAFLGSFEI